MEWRGTHTTQATLPETFTQDLSLSIYYGLDLILLQKHLCRLLLKYLNSTYTHNPLPIAYISSTSIYIYINFRVHYIFLSSHYILPRSSSHRRQQGLEDMPSPPKEHV